jgi:hypothetical protein
MRRAHDEGKGAREFFFTFFSPSLPADGKPRMEQPSCRWRNTSSDQVFANFIWEVLGDLPQRLFWIR